MRALSTYRLWMEYLGGAVTYRTAETALETLAALRGAAKVAARWHGEIVPSHNPKWLWEFREKCNEIEGLVDEALDLITYGLAVPCPCYGAGELAGIFGGIHGLLKEPVDLGLDQRVPFGDLLGMVVRAAAEARTTIDLREEGFVRE